MKRKRRPFQLQISLYPIWGIMVGLGQFNYDEQVFRLALGILGIEFHWEYLDEEAKKEEI